MLDGSDQGWVLGMGVGLGVRIGLNIPRFAVVENVHHITGTRTGVWRACVKTNKKWAKNDELRRSSFLIS